ncbi:alpha/beta hydrolase [Salinicola rhizosphaerae]|uniref:Acyl-CoA:diacylglycerol acyltransferase n=1 Tax=Salinicola rhizosphaerae TaxID=1443141 RepID=A0ABQ3DWK6_9GAMM|nr:alpha/beta hydrolase-fold protein [Salinicola rhizosphaerae]GHB18490.1 IroE protein [Salinicola rhizosphaerae]
MSRSKTPSDPQRRRMLTGLARTSLAGASLASLGIAGSATLARAGRVSASQAPADPPVVLDHSRQWRIHNAAGDAYRIMISLPEGAPPEGGYPVLYVLDGNGYFPPFHAARETVERYRKTIIIGVGYPEAQALNFLRRSYDFSPPAPPDHDDPPQGGQDEFLAFLEQRLMPKVEAELPINPHQQSLFGHSFGGMFAIYALFNRPRLFAHVVAVSPTLWWDSHYLLALEPGFVEAVNTRQFKNPPSLALIAAEGDTPQEIQEAQAMAARLEPLAASGFRSSYALIPGVDHETVPFKIVPRVMREVFEVGYTP